ncbi:MAG: bifunctional sugar-1-phosphate nucleotidylyltransferase/acetyltransferase [Candidatus Woesearchaeota archaeon]
MKAVILAAGKATRTYPLTITTPKPLLMILNKTIIEHNLDQLTGLVNEVIIVVGFMQEKIKQHLGDQYKSIKITYVEQKQQLGTANALLAAEHFVDNRFIVLYGDDLYSGKDLKQLAKHEYAAIAKKVEEPSRFGVFIGKKDRLDNIVEKPKQFISDLANIGCYLLDNKIFAIIKNLKKSARGELELTDAINQLAKSVDFTVVQSTDYWLPIAYWWNYLEANVFMLNQIEKSNIQGQVEDNVTIKGILVLGKDSVIKSGTYIEGPVYISNNCEIGPNAFLRKDTIIMEGVRTRAEIVDSVILRGTTAKHQCYIGHSVIGNHCNIAYGTVTADFRHDGKNHITVINGNKIDTGRRKLGACLGDNVNTGINTGIYPGRKIWPNKTTLPGEIVEKDIE